MRISQIVMICILLYCTECVQAQKGAVKNGSRQRGASDFPELVIAEIPGAPSLMKPQLIMGETGPVMAEGMGWASPAVLDWDGDGKKDLLIGEFGSGAENKMPVGNFMRVYQNEGSDDRPVFSDIFRYARGCPGPGTGTPLSIYTWCCMAFTPRVADLNNDGYPDLLSGQFEPGNVMWFKGSEKGFLPPIPVDQGADPMKIVSNQFDYTKDVTDITGVPYWSYSAVAFGDFDGDGDQDMVVGGSSLRFSENTGTKTDPAFGPRKRLLDIDGQPLALCTDDPERWDRFLAANSKSTGVKTDLGGDLCVPFVIDWDSDGVLDILLTSAYVSKGDILITLFRGAKTSNGMRFEKGIPLITTKNKEKAFPGTNPNVIVTDWNNDGIHDLVIGVNVATVKGKFYPAISWDWEQPLGTYHLSPADYDKETLKIINHQMAYEKAYQDSTKLSTEALNKQHRRSAEQSFRQYFIKEEYRDLSHKGYVYVMLGKKNNK